MPFTEIVIPSFKQDSDSKEAMQKIWPAASSVFHRTPAILSGHVGYIFLDNGSNVRADLTRMSLFEWENLNGFEAFLASKEFKTFISQVGPFLSEPAGPQLFETDLALRHLAPSPATEIIRLRADPDFSRDGAWGKLIGAIEDYSGNPRQAICGRSVNLEEEIWLGIVTWDSIESRDFIYKQPEVQSARRILLHGQEPDIVIVETEALVSPRECGAGYPIRPSCEVDCIL